MDPGTALSVASLVCDLAKDLYDYYRAWKDCDKDVEELRVQLIWLHKAFKTTRDTIRSSELSENGTKLVFEAMSNCNDSANELRDLLDKIKSHSSPKTILDKLKAQGRKAYYPFRKSTVAAIAENVEDCRNSLHFSLSLLGLQTAANIAQELHTLDTKLVAGFDDLETSVETLQVGLEEISDNTAEIKATTTAMQDEASLRAVLEWLSPVDYSPQLHDFSSSQTPGTGNWFLGSAEFISWSNGNKSTMLCPGHPGTGKTMIAVAVINHLLKTVYSRDSAVIYVFCNYKRHGEQTAGHFLRALLRQMIHAKACVPLSVSDLYSYHKSRNTQPSLEELTKVISSAAEGFDKVYIVIDALDECDSKTRRSLLPAVQNMQAHGDVKILATSRPLSEVQNSITVDVVLEIKASEDDLALHLRSNMGELPRRVRDREDLQEQIVAGIIKAADRVFLLANLHMQSLKDKRTPRDIVTALENLPTGSNAYDSTYKKAMERIRCQQKGECELAELVLMWISCAYRPLTSAELRHAVAVRSTSKTIDEDDLELTEEILSVCTGMVIEDEQSGIIRLVHYTAQEYLNRTRDEWFPNAEAHIALRCLWYQSFDDFDRPSVHLDYSDFRYPLLSYAAEYWGSHYSKGDSNRIEYPAGLASTAQQFLTNDNLMSNSWRQIRPFDVSGTTGLHISAYFGLTSLMRHLLQRGHCVDADDSGGRTPLWFAASRGQKDAVQCLLKAGANVNAHSLYGDVLCAASGEGYTDIVRILLDNGADINKCTYNRCALGEAASYGHIDTMEVLLDHGAATELAVFHASTNYQKDAILLLFDHGVILKEVGEALTRMYDFPLKVLQLLLLHGPALDVLGNVHHSVLVHDDIEAVRTLFTEDVSVDAYGIAILIATMLGHEEILRCLLDRGAKSHGDRFSGAQNSVSFMDFSNLMRVALFMAVYAKFVSIVCVLLDFFLDTSSLSEALERAIGWRYDTNILQLLLDRGAHANKLHQAVFLRNVDAVRILLDNGAAVDGKDYDTAVRVASRHDLPDIKQMLLYAAMPHEW